MKRKRIIGIIIFLLMFTTVFICVNGIVNAIDDYSDFEIEEIDGGLCITKYNGHDEVVRIPSKIGGKDVIKIGDYAFAANKSIKTLIIPDSVVELGLGAFANCTGITDITIPVDIKYNASGRDMLPESGGSSGSSMYYGDTMSFEGSNKVPTFSNCKNVESITYTKGKTGIMPDRKLLKDYQSEDDYYYGYTLETLARYNNYIMKLENIVFEDGITHIGDYAFATDYNAPYSFKYNTPNSVGFYSIQSVVLPESVTSIGRASFAGNCEMTISSLENITSYGKYAFFDCSSIDSLIINSKVEEIPDYAFTRCSGIKTKSTLVIPESVEELGIGAFANCTGITDITIPVDIKYNASGRNMLPESSGSSGSSVYYGDTMSFESSNKVPTFSNCKNVESITYTKGKTGIMPDRKLLKDYQSEADYYYGYTLETLARYNNYIMKLKNIVFEDGITHIGDYAFATDYNAPYSFKYNTPNSVGFYSIQSVVLPESVTSIGRASFAGNCEMTISSLENITSYGKYAFFDCSSIDSLIINSKVEEIPDYAFTRCSGIKTKSTLVIPESVEELGIGAFANCTGITDITIPVDIKYNASGRNMLPESSGSSGSSVYYGDTMSFEGSNKVPTFSNCKNVESITYTKGKTGIMPDRKLLKDYQSEDDYYYGYTLETLARYNNYIMKLENIVFEDGITHIGDYAFATDYNAPYSFKYNTPNSVGFYSIQSVVLPESVTSIGRASFAGNCEMTISSLENITSYGKYAFFDCSSIDSLIINSKVEEIPDYAFTRCSGIKTKSTLVIPESVEELGIGAFANCTGITDITIPVDIKYNASGRNMLPESSGSSGSSVYYGDTMSFEGSNKVPTFSNCKNVESITYTKGKTGIMPDRKLLKDYQSEDDYYYGYTLETLARYNNYIMKLENIVFEDGITHIGDYAFATDYNAPYSFKYNTPNSVGFYSIQSVVLPESVTSIGRASFAGNCEMTISSLENISSMGEYAFYDCVFEELELGTDLESIPDHCFENISELNSVFIPANVNSIGEDSFTKNDSLVIYGYEDSSAEQYALGKEIPFVCVDNLSIIGEKNVIFTGDTRKFNASLYIDSVGFIKDFVWSIENNESSLTKISTDGSLFVATGETADTITVTATYEDFTSSIEIPVRRKIIIDENNIIDSGSCYNYYGGYNAKWYITKDGAFSDGTIAYKLSILGSGSLGIYDYNVPWYKYLSKIKSVEIEYGIADIAYNSFNNCSRLINVSIPDSVTEIYGYAFGNCSSLKTISIPNNVNTLGASCFKGCSSLESIVLPNSLTEISSSLFEGCNSLRDISIPDGVTLIDNNAFYGCGEETVVIPSSVLTINNGAFGNSANLSKIIFTGDSPIIGQGVFNSCDSLEFICVPYEKKAQYLLVENINNDLISGYGRTVEIMNSELGSVSASGGTITVNGDEKYYEGGIVKLSSVPAEGYVLSSYVVKDSDDNNISVNNDEFVLPDDDITISATFIRNIDNPTIEIQENNIVYDGTAKEPAVIVRDGDLIIDENEYSVTYADNINAGTGRIIISNKDGGSLLISGSTTFVINKAEPSYTLPGKQYSTYGNELASIELPSGWTWENGEEILANYGTNSFCAIYTPDDTDNYNNVRCSLDVDVTGDKTSLVNRLNQYKNYYETAKEYNIDADLLALYKQTYEDALDVANDTAADQDSIDGALETLNDVIEDVKWACKVSVDMAAANEVISLIEKLPALEDVLIADKEDVKDARKAYDALNSDEKQYIDEDVVLYLESLEEKIQALLDSVSNVTEMMDSLPVYDGILITEWPNVQTAREAYDALTSEQKNMIDANVYKKLIDSEYLLSPFVELKEMIDAIPDSDTIGLADETQVNEAISKYNELTAFYSVDRLDVDTENKLWEADRTIKSLYNSADTVKELINALPTTDDISLEDASSVEQARTSYDALREDQKNYLGDTISQKLIDSEEAVIVLQEAAAKEAADKAAVEEMTNLINSLPDIANITTKDNDVIAAVRTAYENLSEDQKNNIDAEVLQKLVNTETALAKAFEQANNSGTNNATPTTDSAKKANTNSVSISSKKQTDSKEIKNETPTTSYKNEWVDGKWYDSSGKNTYSGTLQWKKNNDGWWVEDTKGWYPQSQWQKIDGKWYYFTEDGYMDYGEYRDGCWLNEDGSWDENYSNGKWHLGSKGWWYSDGSWYPTNQSLWIDGTKYHFNAEGYWDK